VIAAPREAVLAAARSVTLQEMPLAAALLALRAARLRRPPPEPFVRLLERRVGLANLAHDADGDVWAAALRPWLLRGESRRVPDLAAFSEPGWVKVAADLTVESHADGTLLATQTRIAATSDDARRAFARYWRVVRPGSGVIRVSWLRAAERRALRA
jgi:hypothetical protein